MEHMALAAVPVSDDADEESGQEVFHLPCYAYYFPCYFG
jgi:hypothetical protein